jgi:hypothetical protein
MPGLGRLGHAGQRWIGCALIIPMIIQTIRLDPSGAVWTDKASNVSRPDPSGAYWFDAEHPARFIARRWPFFVGPLRAKEWRADDWAGPAGRTRFAGT